MPAIYTSGTINITGHVNTVTSFDSNEAKVVAVTAAEQTVTFAQEVENILIVNDDGGKPVYMRLDTDALTVANAPIKVLEGGSLEKGVKITSFKVRCDGVDTTTLRITGFWNS